MSPTLKPCACGYVEEPEWKGHRFQCGRCAAKTPCCPTPEAAARCWNAMQMSLEEGVVGMVPLRWRKTALFARVIPVGRIGKNVTEWLVFDHLGTFLKPCPTREQAEAALLAHVMEGK